MTQRRSLLFCTIISLICLLILACDEPSPLYGNWADNLGNTISFYEDDTFNVSITSSGVSRSYDGNFTVLMNSLTFTCTSETLTVVTEWDIRGNMLYIDWPVAGSVSHLTLYKTSN